MYPTLPAFDDLQALHHVARTGSISAAARELAIHQQTMSTRVARAENTLGLTVFNRSPYGVTITERGAKVIEALPALFEAAGEFTALVAALNDDTSARHLHIAVSNTVAELYYPVWAARFHALYPTVQLAMRQANSTGVRDLVTSGEVAVGIVEGGTTPHHLEETDLGTDELVLVVTPDHPWAGTTATAEMLRTTALVVREKGSGTRGVVEDVLGTLATPAGEFGSLASQRAGIVALGAPGVIARGAVADQIALGRLVVVDTPGLTFVRHLHAVRLRGASPNDDAEALIHVARSEM
ncbi:LysR family transcriptional regulator [Corynebacterium cystitidis]|uniref:LysR family transcriptional regulator n=1 Tax=Corynebacterium cystitidis TaxID=35757 RepID=UPI00211E03A0|nr:LysR family transcriptional regulator [Corynebacterium cystitidis]